MLGGLRHVKFHVSTRGKEEGHEEQIGQTFALHKTLSHCGESRLTLRYIREFALHKRLFNLERCFNTNLGTIFNA